MRIITLLLLLLQTSCSKHIDNILVVETHAKLVKPANLSDVFNKGKMIRLDSDDSCIISAIGQVNTTKDFIFVSEIRRLLQFDRSGHFLKQIGSRGKGPGQFTTVHSIAIDSVAKRIFISSRNLLCYDFDGSFIHNLSQIESVNKANGYINVINGLLWVHNIEIAAPIATGGLMNLDRFYMYNQHFQITDSIVVRKILLDIEEFAVGGREYFISDLNSGIYLYCPVLVTEPMLRDTLYKMNGLSAQPIMKLDFSDILSVEEGVNRSMSNMTPQVYNEATLRVRNMTIHNIFRTERYVFTEYYYLDKPYFFCYDLFNQKGYNMAEGFTDDLFGTGQTVNLMPLNLRNGEFCFVKNGYELEGIMDGVNENSNPVVFFIKSKE